MKYLIITNTLVLVGLCILVGSQFGVFQNPFTAPPNADSPGTHLAELLSAGLGDTSDEAHSDALIPHALDGQSLHPTAADEVWACLKGYYANRSGYDRVVGLTIYLNSVEGTLETCPNVDVFEKLWEIRKDVVSERNKAVETWRNELEIELAAFRIRVENGEWQKTIASAENQQKAEQLQNQVQMYADLAESTNQSLPDEVGKIAIAFREGISLQLEKINKEADSEHGRDLNNESIEPALGESKDSSRGGYQKLLEDLEIIDNKAKSEECAFWMAQLPETVADVPSATEKVTKDVSDCSVRIWKLQRLRYNRWALQVIYSAADSPQWYEELGTIETGHLDFSVHSLYSMTHDDRLGKENDLGNRTDAVQVLLSKKKIPLEAF